MLFGLVFYPFFVAALIKILMVTENPKICAGLATLTMLVFSGFNYLSGEVPFYKAFLPVLIVLPVSYAYFWMLNRFEMASGPWWFVLLVGALAPFLVMILA